MVMTRRFDEISEVYALLVKVKIFSLLGDERRLSSCQFPRMCICLTAFALEPSKQFHCARVVNFPKPVCLPTKNSLPLACFDRRQPSLGFLHRSTTTLGICHTTSAASNLFHRH
jgi:hypothetical protein